MAKQLQTYDIDHLKGIYNNIPQINKITEGTSTCNRLNSETPRSQPIMPQNLLNRGEEEVDCHGGKFTKLKQRLDSWNMLY